MIEVYEGHEPTKEEREEFGLGANGPTEKQEKTAHPTWHEAMMKRFLTKY